jgi:glycosyltransferase involved in cell wall biosynthesis
MNIVIDIQGLKTCSPEDRATYETLIGALVGGCRGAVSLVDARYLSDDASTSPHSTEYEGGLVPIIAWLPGSDPLFQTRVERRASEDLRAVLLTRARTDVVIVFDALNKAVINSTRLNDRNFRTILLASPSSCLDDYEGDQNWANKKSVIREDAYCLIEVADEPEETQRALLSVLDHLLDDASLGLRATKPLLAYVSPMPPSRSGVADYSVELLPYLDQYYDIEVVCGDDCQDNSWLLTRYQLRDEEFLRNNYARYDRVVYHIGNSSYHAKMISLLRCCSGVVVLHDFFLGHLFEYMNASNIEKNLLEKSIYYSHGWGGLDILKHGGREAAVWQLPSNREILDIAAGVIVHSDYARTSAIEWYGADYQDTLAVVPLLRSFNKETDRARARAALGFASDEIVVCSFGVIGPTKLTHRLVDAWNSWSVAKDKKVRLVLVGSYGEGAYGKDILKSISEGPSEAFVQVTGYVTPDSYQTYLEACDIAVQLRTKTRGESSRAVLDCLANNVPTIVNAHGALREFPDSAVLKIPDEFEDSDLLDALNTLVLSPERRSQMSEAGRAYVLDVCSPEKVARQYYDAIEGFFDKNNVQELNEFYRRIRFLLQTDSASEERIIDSCAANFPTKAVRQIFYDVSAIINTDLRTGIQRVVRGVMNVLLKSPDVTFRCEPVYAQGDGCGYRYARRYTASLFGYGSGHLHDEPIEARNGDIFLGVDLAPVVTAKNEIHLKKLRTRGVSINFVIHDILPIARAEFFPETTAKEFHDWFAVVTRSADRLICTTKAGAHDLTKYLNRGGDPSSRQPMVGWFRLSGEIDASIPTSGMTTDEERLVTTLNDQLVFLMVGTIEPRKMHRQVLEAFDILWARGLDARLLIVGKVGWMMDDLVKHIRVHPEFNKRLYWINPASDEFLLMLYKSASALIMASTAEGFGLPIVEASRYGLPLILRKLPVFEEVANGCAFFFEGEEGEALAHAIEEWVSMRSRGEAPSSLENKDLSWKESVNGLLRLLHLT